MLLAWLKLRQRTLGPVLDATGWAINGRIRINVPLGAATDPSGPSPGQLASDAQGPLRRLLPAARAPPVDCRSSCFLVVLAWRHGSRGIMVVAHPRAALPRLPLPRRNGPGRALPLSRLPPRRNLPAQALPQSRPPQNQRHPKALLFHSNHMKPSSPRILILIASVRFTTVRPAIGRHGDPEDGSVHSRQESPAADGIITITTSFAGDLRSSRMRRVLPRTTCRVFVKTKNNSEVLGKVERKGSRSRRIQPERGNYLTSIEM